MYIIDVVIFGGKDVWSLYYYERYCIVDFVKERDVKLGGVGGNVIGRKGCVKWRVIESFKFWKNKGRNLYWCRIVFNF